MTETPTLQKVIQEAIKAHLLDIHTCMPAVVTKVDHEKKTVEVKPNLRRKYKIDEQATPLPLIVDVPLGFLQTKTSIISVPVKIGDDVLLFFTERSIDIWKQDGETEDPKNPKLITPEDTRVFHLSDAVAFPMIKPIGKGLPSDPEAILIKNGDSTTAFYPDGTFEFKNKGDDFLKLVSEFMEETSKIITNTQIGPQPPINKAEFLALKERMDKLIKT